MPEFLRALVYVLVVSVPTFVIAKKIVVPLVDEDEFRRWRNCWIGTTCAAFLSPSLIAFAAMMLVASLYINRYARQPVYFYIILMFAAPCVPVDFGLPGIFNKILELNPPRLFALLILLPAAATLWSKPSKRQLGFPDLCVLLFCVLIIALSSRYGDVNATLRMVLQYFLDIVLPYYVFSRSIQTPRDVNRALLAFAVAAIPVAAVGVFEMWKYWRLYYVVVQEWDVVLITPYLVRDNMLRAATTSIEPIAFGFVCMTAAGCLVTLRRKVNSSLWYYAGLFVLLAGLFSSLSRGPWLGFVIFACIVLAAYPKTATRIVAGIAPVVLCAIYFAPSSAFQRLLNLLPFVGSVDKGNEDYRSDLFTNAVVVIDRYPVFGSHTFLQEPEMQTLIQGQGIIDVVNSYLQIALEFGLVGLSLFLLFFFSLGAYLLVKTMKPPSIPINHAGLLALLVSMLITIATTSSVSVIPYIYWTFAAICAALPWLAREAPAPGRPVDRPVKMRVLSGVSG